MERRFTPYGAVKAVAKREAKKEIKKLNPTGQEVQISLAPWGALTAVATGSHVTRRVGSTIDLGNNQGDRLTNSIRMKGMKYQLKISNETTGTGSVWYLRCICVQGKDYSGNPFEANGGIWETDGDTLLPVDYASNDVMNLHRKINRNRYVVLHDKKVSFMPLNTSLTADPKYFYDRMKVIKGYVKINRKLRYNVNHLSDERGVLPNIWFTWFIQDEYGSVLATGFKYANRFDEYFEKQ